MPSNHLILCCPLLLPPSISQHQGLFQWVSSSHHVAKVLEFQLQQQSFQWIFRTDFLRIDWFDLLKVQGTLKSLFQHHSSKTSILQCSAFFIVQLTYPYITTGKTIALTLQTFVGKVMCLLVNMLSRLVITFLSRSKHLLISWLQSPSTAILEPPKIKSATVSTFVYMCVYICVCVYMYLLKKFIWLCQVSVMAHGIFDFCCTIWNPLVLAYRIFSCSM